MTSFGVESNGPDVRAVPSLQPSTQFLMVVSDMFLPFFKFQFPRFRFRILKFLFDPTDVLNDLRQDLDRNIKVP